MLLDELVLLLDEVREACDMLTHILVHSRVHLPELPQLSQYLYFGTSKASKLSTFTSSALMSVAASTRSPKKKITQNLAAARTKLYLPKLFCIFFVFFLIKFKKNIKNTGEVVELVEERERASLLLEHAFLEHRQGRRRSHALDEPHKPLQRQPCQKSH